MSARTIVVLALLCAGSVQAQEREDPRQWGALCRIFKDLKVEAAIPFLIRHMDQGTPGVRELPWLKTESVVRDRLPAVDALIEIGPAAAQALIASWDETDDFALYPALYVITHVQDPRSRAFLEAFKPQYEVERWWIKEALDRLDQR